MIDNPSVQNECENNPRFNQLLRQAINNGLPETLYIAYLDSYWGCTDLQVGIATKMLPGYSWSEYLATLNSELMDKYVNGENPRIELLFNNSLCVCRKRIRTICGHMFWQILENAKGIKILTETGEVYISIPHTRDKDIAWRILLNELELLE